MIVATEYTIDLISPTSPEGFRYIGKSGITGQGCNCTSEISQEPVEVPCSIEGCQSKARLFRSQWEKRPLQTGWALVDGWKLEWNLGDISATCPGCIEH